MAVDSICGNLRNGQDNTCLPTTQRKYFQQAVLINRLDIDYTTSVVTLPSETECNYSVAFSLKEDKTGYRFSASESGSSIKGWFDKSRSDLGNAQYIHQVQLLVMNILESSKCVLSGLDLGNFVVALQNGQTVEIFGFYNGLSTADYTYDVAEGGGGALINLASLEDNPEGILPLVYKSGTLDGEVADFDANFANPAA